MNFEHRKFQNISPGPIDIFKLIFGGSYSGGLHSGGAYIQRAFCVSIFVFKTLMSVIISIECSYYRQKRALFKPQSS